MIYYRCKKFLHKEICHDYADCISLFKRSDCHPCKLSKALSIKEGSLLVIYSDGENIILKPVELSSKDKLSALLAKAREYAEKDGLTEKNIDIATKGSRKASKELT